MPILNISHRRFGLVLAVLLLTGLFISVPARSEDTTKTENLDNIQKTINILENDERRAEVIRLLKLMAAINDESTPAEKEVQGEVVDETENRGVKVWMSGRVNGAFRQLQAAHIGVKQSWATFHDVLAALAQPEAVEMWRPYILKIFAWGLVCLLAAAVIINRYGALPTFKPTFNGRLLAVCRYLLIMVGPNLALIASFLAIPPPSATAPGVTANMGIGFSFIHVLIQHFFITLSLLYICLRAADALMTRNKDGLAVIDLHPVIARHFLHSWRVFIVYLAIYIFIKDTILENFVSGALYSMILALMSIPVPIYLTLRLKKLKRLAYAVHEAEVSAGDDFRADGVDENDEIDAPVPQQSRLDYRADLFLLSHWSSLTIVCVWVLSLISVFDPIGTSDRFVSSTIASFAVMAGGALVIKLQRAVMLRLVARDQEQGRRLLLTTDTLVNIMVWLWVTVMVLTIWGLPVGAIIDNPVISDIASRGFAIAVVVTAMVVFIKFSRLATEWLLTIPDFAQNRNWRTMTPLLLTAVRALAVFVGMVVILDRLGVNVGPIMAGAGILGLGVGMGAQSLVKDVINGISILLMDTLSVGDYVTIGGRSGTVEEVGLRTIRLRDSSGNLIVVPNSSVADIVNMTRDYSQDLIDFVVPYDADPEPMMKLAADVAAELDQDPKWKVYLTAPSSLVGVTAFDPNGTTIRLKIFTSAGNQWAVGRELRLRLKKALLEAGIKSTWFGQNLFLFKGQRPGVGVSRQDSDLVPDSESSDTP